MTPTRPLLRWHGGKWRLAPWIIQHFPRHRIYTEAYGGAASVLLRKPRSYAEIYNDLDGDVVNLMRVVRSADADRLVRQIEATPFAREEFVGAYEEAGDVVERARRLVVRSFMGFGSDGFNTAQKTGFRGCSNRSGTTPAHDWVSYPTALRAIIERLRGVVIENRPASEVIRAHDSADTLHYLDPPYMPGTRSKKSRRTGERYHAYRHEMTVADHEEMLHQAGSLNGAVIISGYPTAMYDAALPSWRRVDCRAIADGARSRTEVLWINQAAVQSLAGQLNLQGIAHAC